MNNARRKVLGNAIDNINKAIGEIEGSKDEYPAKASDLILEAKEAVEGIAGEEQESFDKLSEGLQQSERGQRMEEVANSLEGAASRLEELADTIDEAHPDNKSEDEDEDDDIDKDDWVSDLLEAISEIEEAMN